MPSRQLLAPLALLASIASAATAVAPPVRVQSATAPELLTAAVERPGELCVESPASGRECFPLPAGTIVQSIEPDRAGWIASGRTLADGDVHLYLLAGGPGGVRLLPPLPRRPADQRGNPTPLVDEDGLVGVAWLQYGAAQEHAVWAAAWDGARWSEPRLVAPGGEQAQVALGGAVLPDGRWLLTWTRHDGEDDETVYSVGGGRHWTEARRLLADNDRFDILPAVTATPSGALAAWSRFDGNDYRAVVAFFDGSSWSEVATLPGRGVDQPSFTRLGGGIQLLYSSVVPESWHLVHLDPEGRVLAAQETAGATRERPLVEPRGPDPPGLRWPGREGAPPRRIDTTPRVDPEGETFRYMAFGDSITEGKACPGPNPPWTGYPTRLPSSQYLNCAVNGCFVANHGLGGEQTNEGVTRIQGILDNQGPWDVVLLMEGTNDICFTNRTNQQVQNALGQMEALAAARGVDTLHLSIIDLNPEGTGPGGGAFPCPGDLGREDDMEVRVRDNLANVDPDTGYRWWANTRSNASSPPEVTSPFPMCNNSQSCMNSNYADWGHPNCDGFDRLTDEIRDGIVAKPKPNTVGLVSPVGTVFTATPVFQWNKETPRDATWYRIEVNGPGGTIFEQWRSEASCSAATATCSLAIGALADGSYSWRVRGRNPRGRSAWTQTSFSVLTPPSAPDPVSPSGSIGDPRPVFTWNKESPVKASSYRVQVIDASQIVVSDTLWDAGGACTGSSCSADPFASGLLLVDGAYTWRVLGINEAGEGTWSHTLAFAVDGTDGIFADGFESGTTARWDSSL